ncbi:Uncharacterized mitochondrial protein AtMg01250 [Linum perenne]
MSCISSSNFQIWWNGSCSDSFTPSRGLRQGCPLSPYLFTLCIERLSRMILSAVGFGYWKPIILAKGGPPLSHYFFADDLILFGKASAGQARVISDILDASARLPVKLLVSLNPEFTSRGILPKGFRRRLFMFWVLPLLLIWVDIWVFRFSMVE